MIHGQPATEGLWFMDNQLQRVSDSWTASYRGSKIHWQPATGDLWLTDSHTGQPIHILSLTDEQMDRCALLVVGNLCFSRSAINDEKLPKKVWAMLWSKHKDICASCGQGWSKYVNNVVCKLDFGELSFFLGRGLPICYGLSSNFSGAPLRYRKNLGRSLHLQKNLGPPLPSPQYSGPPLSWTPEKIMDPLSLLLQFNCQTDTCNPCSQVVLNQSVEKTQSRKKLNRLLSIWHWTTPYGKLLKLNG